MIVTLYVSLSCVPHCISERQAFLHCTEPVEIHIQVPYLKQKSNHFCNQESILSIMLGIRCPHLYSTGSQSRNEQHKS